MLHIYIYIYIYIYDISSLRVNLVFRDVAPHSVLHSSPICSSDPPTLPVKSITHTEVVFARSLLSGAHIKCSYLWKHNQVRLQLAAASVHFGLWPNTASVIPTDQGSNKPLSSSLFVWGSSTVCIVTFAVVAERRIRPRTAILARSGDT